MNNFQNARTSVANTIYLEIEFKYELRDVGELTVGETTRWRNDRIPTDFFSIYIVDVSSF